MNVSRYFIPLLIITALNLGTALADDNKGSTDDAKKQWEDFRDTQTLRHEMILELFDMNRQVINILRNLNHHPSKADIETLDRMEVRMDELLKKDEIHSKKMMKKWKQGDEKSWDDKKSWEKEQSDAE